MDEAGLCNPKVLRMNSLRSTHLNVDIEMYKSMIRYFPTKALCVARHIEIIDAQVTNFSVSLFVMQIAI